MSAAPQDAVNTAGGHGRQAMAGSEASATADALVTEPSSAPFVAPDVAAAIGADAADGRYLLFAVQEAGVCALPLESVLAVAAPDGPFHSVPNCGGAGSRFLGMVSVRGQVQLGFDLTRRLTEPQRAWQLPQGESLLVVTAGGRAAALRVAPPLRLAQSRALVKTPPLSGSWADYFCEQCFYEPPAKAGQAAVMVRVIAPALLLRHLETEVRRG